MSEGPTSPADELPFLDAEFFNQLKARLQVNSRTLLIDDYVNQYDSLCQLLYAIDQSEPLFIAELKSELVRAAKAFPSYRQYLRSQVTFINEAFLGNKIPESDIGYFAEELCLMSPHGQTVDEISLEFQRALAVIQTEGDIPRLHEIIDLYIPLLKKLFENR